MGSMSLGRVHEGPLPVVDSPLTTRSLFQNQDLRRQARHLFMAGIFVTEICETLDVSRDELGVLAFGADGTGQSPSCWAYQRLERPASSAVTYERVKPFLLKTVEARFINRVRASILALEESNTLLNMQDMSRAVDVVEKLDRITRLEEGKATEHIAQTRTTFTLRELERSRHVPVTVSSEVSPNGSAPSGCSGVDAGGTSGAGGDRDTGTEAQPEDCGVFTVRSIGADQVK